FLESLGVSRVLWQELLPESMREKEKAFSLNFFSLRQNLSRPGLSQEEKEKLRLELARQEEAYLVFLSQMRYLSPELAQIFSPQQVTLEWAQENLTGSDTAVVEYFIGEKKSLLICLTRDDGHFFALPGRDEIKDSLRGYLKLLSSPPSDDFLGELASKRLYRELLGRAEKVFPPNIKRLIIVPDDVLFFLPFETLSSPFSSEKEEFLTSRYSVSYSPSVSSLALLNTREKKSYPVHFLGLGNPSYSGQKISLFSRRVSSAEILMDVYQSQGFSLSPLPGSEREVKKISRLFPESKSKIFLRENAREEVLKQEDIRQAQVIHFACHGFLDLNFPFRSALVLSQLSSSREDGFFQVREVYTCPIEAEMVVLSACQTGKGTLERGEGLVGLPRVFFISGARSVVSTLWNIEDRPAADFMLSFYTNLYRGMNKAEALGKTKQEMLRSKKYSHPHYWGAFVLNGDALSTIEF
ncbi:MAG: CHAT domain-containing protein, partial [Acidobacteriota bacterium]